MDELELPSFYVVNRTLPREQLRPVVDALGITPINLVIISDLVDTPLANEFCSNIIRAADSVAALEIAMTISGTDRLLVIGQADLLDAVYPDGRKERVSCVC